MADGEVERADGVFILFPTVARPAGAGCATVVAFAPPPGSGRSRRPGAPIDDGSHLLGESQEIRDVVARLQRIAPSQAAVMLVGESGTGKEVAARMLHAHSRRATQPFVAVNCSAIPANLVEAELFGYERGAFTGAVRQHEGYFERASGGTLFLDEITEMPFELQAKLLRVLETGRMHRVGGADELTIDVRVVTATNTAPEAAVRERRLREDLFYRLAVIRVDLPPLRQRGDDVGLLAQAFLDRLNHDYGTRKRFLRGTLAAASRHPWPGNVRELRNCVERSYLLCDEVVTLDLPAAMVAPDSANDAADCIHLPIGVTMLDAERELLLATLRFCGGNRRRTASVLGVSPKTVYNKLVGYDCATSAGASIGPGGRVASLVSTARGD